MNFNLKMPDVHLLAVDPGETTGVVEIRGGGLVAGYALPYSDLMESAAFDKPPVRRWADCYNLWVMEDFRVYPWANLGFDPVRTARLLGALEVAALRHGVKIEYQMAGMAKQMATNELLERLGWLGKLKGPHVKDAARHAACYMLRQLAQGGGKVT